jgi:acetyltransferase-like isoleucine patch superfamily enzyme
MENKKIMKQLKNYIKLAVLHLRLRQAQITNLHPWTAIGKYTIIQTDKTSCIQLNDHIAIHNYVSVLAEDHASIVFGKRIFIGDYTSIRANRAQIKIGSNTMLSQGVQLISTNHAYMNRHKLIHEQDIDEQKKGIEIGEDCWLGAGVIVLPGVVIGRGVVVGANAVVTKNIPDYAVVAGNPATIIKYRA